MWLSTCFEESSRYVWSSHLELGSSFVACESPAKTMIVQPGTWAGGSLGYLKDRPQPSKHFESPTIFLTSCRFRALPSHHLHNEVLSLPDTLPCTGLFGSIRTRCSPFRQRQRYGQTSLRSCELLDDSVFADSSHNCLLLCVSASRRAYINSDSHRGWKHEVC